MLFSRIFLEASVRLIGVVDEVVVVVHDMYVGEATEMKVCCWAAGIADLVASMCGRRTAVDDLDPRAPPNWARLGMTSAMAKR